MLCWAFKCLVGQDERCSSQGSFPSIQVFPDPADSFPVFITSQLLVVSIWNRYWVSGWVQGAQGICLCFDRACLWEGTETPHTLHRCIIRIAKLWLSKGNNYMLLNFCLSSLSKCSHFGVRRGLKAAYVFWAAIRWFGSASWQPQAPEQGLSKLAHPAGSQDQCNRGKDWTLKVVL